MKRIQEFIVKHLVDDWKRGHKWFTTKLLIPAGSLDGLSMLLREEHNTCNFYVPHILHLMAWILLWMALVGRFIKQSK